jgi:hypothetical protein
MSDKSIVVDIGSLKAGTVLERKYIGDLPRMSFSSLILEQNIEGIYQYEWKLRTVVMDMRILTYEGW